MSFKSYALHEDPYCKHYAESHKPVNKKGKESHIPTLFYSPWEQIEASILFVQSMINYLFIFLPQDPMGLANADNAFTLYYVKFRAVAPKVRVSIYFLITH